MSASLEDIRVRFNQRFVECLKECLKVLGWTSRHIAKEIKPETEPGSKDYYKTIDRILNGKVKTPQAYTLEGIIEVLRKEEKVTRTPVPLSQEEFIRKWLDLEIPCRVESTKKRTTLWVLGSYSDLQDSEKEVAQKIVSILPPKLVELGIRVVMGDSEMLLEFAENYRNAQVTKNDVPNAIILLGKIRQRDLRDLFRDTIYYVPDLALLIGGRTRRGRVEEEYDYARKAGIPVLPIPSTGGVAQQVQPTASEAIHLFDAPNRTGDDVDVGDLIDKILDAIRIYVG